MCEEDSAKNMRKSLVAAKDISSGSALDFEMVTARRPGTGLSPAMRPYVMGKRARQDIREGVLLTLEMFE